VRLNTKPANYWDSIEHQRKYFLDYAAIKGFDPLDATNWNSVTYGEITAVQVDKIDCIF